MKSPHIRPRFISDRVRALLDALSNEEIAVHLNCTAKYVQDCRRDARGPIRKARPNGWSDERIAALKKDWADGYSASKIAGRLGGISRNSVISKVHRLGLPGRTTISRVTNKSRKWKLPKPAPAPRPLSPAAQVLKAIKRDGMPIPTPAETDIARVTLQDAADNACRWPCAEPDAASRYEPIFCGNRKIDGLPYCLDHAKRAYAPPPPRRSALVSPVSPPRMAEVANA